MCRFYNNLPAINNGEITGIQLVLQDNLLRNSCDHGQLHPEEIKRLGELLELLSHQKPGLKILEIGSGTGGATKEILLALQGHSPWRKMSNIDLLIPQRRS